MTYNDDEIVWGPSLHKHEEFVKDPCCFAIYVLDNSSSMRSYGGHRYQDGKYMDDEPCTKWEEACFRLEQIVKFNLDRGMNAAYYLLNPKERLKWVPDQDYVFIDGNAQRKDAYRRIKKTILVKEKVFGRSPLTDIVHNIDRRIRSSNFGRDDLICLNIITDGIPDNEEPFKEAVEYLCQKPNKIFMTINLCTDEHRVVKYYERLDKKLFTKIRSMRFGENIEPTSAFSLDVIDDFKNEYEEISQMNSFFCYDEQIHISRMAGLADTIFDIVDEVKFDGTKMVYFLKKINCDIKFPQIHTSKQNTKELETFLQKLNMKAGPKLSLDGKISYAIDVEKVVNAVFKKKQSRCCLPS